MRLWSNSFIDGGKIPGEFAFAVFIRRKHVSVGQSNPHLAGARRRSGPGRLP